MRISARPVLVALGFYLCGVAPAAQAPTFVTLPNGGRVPCDHPLAIEAGLGCTAPDPGPTAADCEPFPDPYRERDRAARCAEWQRSQIQRPPLPTFEVGRTYVAPYPHIRMRVLSVATSSTGVPVVTAEYTGTHLPGEVFAFRVDQALPWLVLP